MKKLFLLLLFIKSCILAQDSPLMLPDSIGEWKAQDSIASYEGENLYRLIDGGADIFLEYGFKSVFTRRYFDRDDNIISVEAYEMIDSAAAFGIFSLFTFKTGKPIEFSCDAYAGDGFLLVQKGKYYISLSANESSGAVQDELIQIGRNIVKNIQTAAKPVLIGKFLISDSSRIAYIKGNLGLYNLSNFEFGKNLKVEEGICLSTDSVRNFILKYKSPDDAAINLENLSVSLKEMKWHEDIVFTKSSLLFVNNEHTYCRLNQYMNYLIIATASDPEKINKLMVILEERIKH